MGIGNDYPRGGQIDWVLGRFTEDDMSLMMPAIEQAVEIVKSFVLAGINVTMNPFNSKKPKCREQQQE